jgi:serine phosphatase RsbU (regulator of sigma subunit)
VPKVVISSFEILDSDGRHEVHIPVANPVVTVNYNQSFSIDFTALDFTNPEKNMYKYSLVELGKEEKLNSVGTKNSVTFSNLTSGEYLFLVTGSNNDNVWNNEGIRLKIIVEAPFWRTRIAYFLYLFLAFALVYWIVQFRTQALRRSNRILRERDIAAKEVSKQKELLSRRNKNIEDSLNYAQRIQKAMLTTSRMFTSILPKSFILHKPKDIVSGDFYWISEVEDKIFVAAVDCTGHGVPGAFMSLIGFELFRKIINMQKITEPGSILNIMNSNFEEIFGNAEDLSLKDGMDLAFCVLDKKKNVIQYAGAFNPLYIIRDNKLLEIKGDRFSVGADTDPEEPVVKEFMNHTIELVKDDMLYIFTDGFADQFGGPEGKKYKYRRFRHLLLTIHNLPLEKQKQYLDDSIEEWIGDLEQIDDILVIGIKPEF